MQKANLLIEKNQLTCDAPIEGVWRNGVMWRKK